MNNPWDAYNDADEECGKLRAVAKAAAVLFRPPYRHFAGINLGRRQEQDDLKRLYNALVAAGIEIGEELT